MSNTACALAGALFLALLLNFITWVDLSDLRGLWSMRNAREFTGELTRDFASPTCHGSSFSYDQDCSVIIDKRPVFFHCDRSGCEPTCGGSK